MKAIRVTKFVDGFGGGTFEEQGVSVLTRAARSQPSEGEVDCGRLPPR